MELKNKYIKLGLNAKTGAFIGGLVGLVVSTTLVVAHPEFIEMPMESKIQLIGIATGIPAMAYGVIFHTAGWASNKIDKYFESDKVNKYFRKLAERR